MNVVGILLGFSAFFLAVETAKRILGVPTEVTRKIAHVGAAIGAACLPAFVTYGEIALTSGIFVVLLVVSKKYGLFSAVHEVSRDTKGEVYFPVAVGLMALCFPSTVPYVFGLLVMGISDTAAAAVGGRARRRYTLLGSDKSYAGNAAFALSTLCIAACVLGWLAGVPVDRIVPVAAGATVVLTAIEAISPRGTDNLTVPLAAGIVIVVLT